MTVKNLRSILPALLLISLLASCHGGREDTPGSDPQPTTRRFGHYEGLVCDTAVVVSAHPRASEIGLEILRSGGNAADAAVAVQFALAVCFSYAGNIGGGGVLVIRDANGKAEALDFREKAPLRARRDMFLDGEGNVVPDLSVKGHLSAGIPGSVAGMVALHEKYGRLPWEQLVQPSVDLAREGYLATAHEASLLNEQRADFLHYNRRGQSYLVKDGDWQAGDTIRQEDLAHSLERIRDHGRAGFYQGETARLLLEEMGRGGIISRADLDGYEAKWRVPLTGMFRGHLVITMPPPSSGGILLLQLLTIAGDFPIDQWGPDAPQTIHAIVEAERRVFADRAEFMGDPDFVTVPMQGLLDRGYLRARMADFDPRNATESACIAHGEPKRESTETTHFSIVDGEGNAISVTTTLNGPYGSKVWVKGAGFLLNNEMDDFSAKPGIPNLFGLVGNTANAIAPGKRMLSSMAPTIVARDGKVFMVLGTPGGSTIPTSIFQVILDVVAHGMSLQEAVDFKRYHHQWLPDEIAVEEDALPAATWTVLRDLGHRVCTRAKIGRVDAVLRRPDGRWEGAADHRRDDAARGF
ncbi:MAG: gamma-glutamyltransferase [Bacteroidota bacterium]